MTAGKTRPGGDAPAAVPDPGASAAAPHADPSRAPDPGASAAAPHADPSRAPDAAALLARAREVVRIEAAAVAALEARLGDEFLRAVEILAACRGKVIVSGVGKSGLLAHQVAATLTSVGTPAVFLHPADALHGDAGLFTSGDVALFLSKSGASDELLALLPYVERHGIALVSIVAVAFSALARRSNVTLVTGPLREACPIDMTPTTSLTVAHVVADCLAVALLERRGLGPEDFRFLHPGGVLGRTASRRVEELMHGGEGLPRVEESMRLREVMLEIMEKRLGIAGVVNAEGKLSGVISDGDFKRILLRESDPWRLTAAQIMSRSPSTIAPGTHVAAAVRQMEERAGGPITALIVIDDDRHPVGVLHLHDCLKSGS